MFSLPGTKIPEWFSHCKNGESISFWFRNKFPAISICLVIGPVDEHPITVKVSPRVFFNRNKQFVGNRKAYEFMISTDHIFLFDIKLLNFEHDANVVLSDDNWNCVEVSYADHITNHEVPIRLAAKYSGIHVLEQTSGMEDVKFTNPQQAMMKTTTNRPQKDDTILLPSAILSSGLVPLPTPSVERPWEDIQEETLERLSEDEVHPTTVQNDSPNTERYEGDEIEVEAVSTRELESKDSSSNYTDSDSDDPFDLVDKKLHVSGEETISYVACSGDASVTSIRVAIGALELLMTKDLSEVSIDPAMQSQVNHFFDLLTTSSHPRVTIELMEALVELKIKVFSIFQEFQATVESVNKLKNFEKEKATIQKETLAGKNMRKDLKNSIKKATLAIKVEKSRKKELAAEIETLRKQLAIKEMDLEQLVLNVKNLEEQRLIYVKNRNSFDDKAGALCKEADTLFAENSGVEDEGKIAEKKQNFLSSTQSSNLRSQFSKIKNNILGLPK